MVLTRPTQRAIIHDPGCHSFLCRCLKQLGDTMYSQPAAESALGQARHWVQKFPWWQKITVHTWGMDICCGKCCSLVNAALGSRQMNHSEILFCVYFLVYIVVIINVSLIRPCLNTKILSGVLFWPFCVYVSAIAAMIPRPVLCWARE